ncbi:MAG: hypothetical protein WC878_04950 [Candidatus Paceibacterota bacterium]
MADSNKKETDAEMLARLMADGFGRMQRQFDELHEEMNNGFNEAHEDMTDVRVEQKETNRRLESLERKQMGTLESLDETVPRSEFNELEGRVAVLETKLA